MWSRYKGSTGGAIYGLCALSISLWTSSDWFLRLESTALPFQVLLWKILFNLSVCFGPALAAHTAAHISHRRFRRDVVLIYFVGVISGIALVSGLVLPFFGLSSDLAHPLMEGGAIMAFLAYIGSLLFVATQLYPLIFSSKTSVLERRRVSYGIILLILFLVAGALQLVVGPVPTGLLLSGITSIFLILSFAAFVRASFLDIHLGALESFLSLLVAFAIVLLLRTRTPSEAIVTLIGSFVVGVFGLLAVNAVESERRKRVMLEQANQELKVLEEAKSDFVDMVAHQLRTPLGGIRASSSMLVEGDYGSLSEKAKTAVGLIEDAATRLISLADTFLSMSRVEVGTYKTRRSIADVRQEISDVVTEMDISAVGKHLKLDATVDPSVPKQLRIDKEALRNALFNLIDNAIKYTDQGKVSIRLHVVDGSLIAEVSDTGAGMTQEDLRDLFKKFHRGDVGRSHAEDGTGLGLYVVRKLVEAAGGRISASSPGPDKGSTFTVMLPVEMAA